MTTEFVWRVAVLALMVGVVAGFVTVAVRGQPPKSLTGIAYAVV